MQAERCAGCTATTTSSSTRPRSWRRWSSPRSRAVGPGGAFTVVGDERQQTDVTAWFRGWGRVPSELGLARPAVVILEGSHRCPGHVVALARCVIGRPGERPVVGDGLAMSRFAGREQRARGIGAALASLIASDGTASAAVVCRDAREARAIARELRRRLTLRLGLHGAVVASSGVVVTDLDEVRGLEFDYVVLPDLTPGQYPHDDESRRALYLAATRARHQLWLVTPGDWSPLLPWRQMTGNAQRCA